MSQTETWYSKHTQVQTKKKEIVFVTMVTYMFLNTELLEFDEFGASRLQVESTSRFVGDTLLTGTHDKRHEGGRLDLRNTGHVTMMRNYLQGI